MGIKKSARIVTEKDEMLDQSRADEEQVYFGFRKVRPRKKTGLSAIISIPSPKSTI
jgi:hypothetical protein